ncbi:NmrA/HSCARG family protein [Amantichitinum ursilacus]|uniref:NAD(P)H azoreductase n=1 Tax=Amantichitinum ursilacus TaxID=857265 RepID=A0A0N0XNS3_9NEIS|nr:NmrA/HSCARG family protein [Amantichitinum ursilacus]KPC55364.1 NAD(P)H azoreductase [Amantichitinum ursilacus]
MTENKQPILVFGATGQQGGSVAVALLRAGRPVRALVRDPAADKASALRAAGAEIVLGDFADTASLRAAMTGAYGVFSVQPSSGMGPLLGISDEEEERYGCAIADLALEAGVQHLVYSSTDAVGDTPTGMGHFDSKARIEAHIRTLPITATIVRPAAFMEMLVMPGFGLDQGQFNFFVQPDQAMQLLAVADIGKYVTAIFADRGRWAGQTLEIASDMLTGRDLEAAFTAAAGHPIRYARFSEEVLAGNAFLAKLTALVDNGRLVGRADLAALRALNPQQQSFATWLAGDGKAAFHAALGQAGRWGYGHG